MNRDSHSSLLSAYAALFTVAVGLIVHGNYTRQVAAAHPASPLSMAKAAEMPELAARPLALQSALALH